MTGVSGSAAVDDDPVATFHDENVFHGAPQLIRSNQL
jgi:hypothetical protein